MLKTHFSFFKSMSACYQFYSISTLMKRQKSRNFQEIFIFQRINKTFLFNFLSLSYMRYSFFLICVIQITFVDFVLFERMDHHRIFEPSLLEPYKNLQVQISALLCKSDNKLV